MSQENLDEIHRGQVAAPDFNLPGIVAEIALSAFEKPESVPPALITDEQYGFCWGVEDFLGKKLVQHGGNVVVETANVTLLPEQRSGVVILANADGASYFAEAVRLYGRRGLTRSLPTSTLRSKRNSKCWGKTAPAVKLTSRQPAPTSLRRAN